MSNGAGGSAPKHSSVDQRNAYSYKPLLLWNATSTNVNDKPVLIEKPSIMRNNRSEEADIIIKRVLGAKR